MTLTPDDVNTDEIARFLEDDFWKQVSDGMEEILEEHAE